MLSKLIGFINLLPYLGKRYYAGREIRWLIEDKAGNNIYCACCGNIANGAMKVPIWRLIFRIPLCNTHIGHFFFKVHPKVMSLTAPVEITYGR